jgi:hypothetical protein
VRQPREPRSNLSKSLVDRKGSFVRVVAFGPQFVANTRLPPLTPAAQTALAELGAEFRKPVRDGQFLRLGELGGAGLLVLARDNDNRSQPPYETARGEIAIDPRTDSVALREGVADILKRRKKAGSPPLEPRRDEVGG